MRISIATEKAVKYACFNFHYAKSRPGYSYAFNVFNDKDEWCGVILYGLGANTHIASAFGLFQGEVFELLRVALNGKQEFTSQCVAATLRELKRINQKIKIIVSYADKDQDHTGIIYQATNWLYLGCVCENKKGSSIMVNGIKKHRRALYSLYGTSNFEYIKANVDKHAQTLTAKGKHKYIFCFDKKLRKKYLKQSLPYPKKDV